MPPKRPPTSRRATKVRDDSAGSGKPARKAKLSERRWDEIVDATARILGEKGYEEMSIQDVADAVGMLKGSLYYYIRTKEELLFAVLERTMQGTASVLDEVRTVDGDAVTKLRAFIGAHVTYNIAHLGEIAAFYHNHQSLTGERAESLREQRHEYTAFVHDLITAAQKEGSFRSDVDPDLVALGLLGMMNWIHRWYRPSGGYTAERISAAFAELVLKGLASPNGQAAKKPPPRGRSR